jgi:hypothetical protein
MAQRRGELIELIARGGAGGPRASPMTESIRLCTVTLERPVAPSLAEASSMQLHLELDVDDLDATESTPTPPAIRSPSTQDVPEEP